MERAYECACDKGHRFIVLTIQQSLETGTKFKFQDDVASGLQSRLGTEGTYIDNPVLAINVLFPSPVSISATTRKTNVRDGGGVRQLFAAA